MITLGLRADRRRGPLPETEPSFWLAELGARFGFEGAHFIGHYSSSSANERWYELFEEILLHVLKDLDPILRDADLLRSLVDDAPVVTHLSASSARPKKQD